LTVANRSAARRRGAGPDWTGAPPIAIPGSRQTICWRPGDRSRSSSTPRAAA